MNAKECYLWNFVKEGKSTEEPEKVQLEGQQESQEVE